MRSEERPASATWTQQSLTRRLRGLLHRAVVTAGICDPAELDAATIPLERPRQAEHGDFATNIAFSLARTARKAPRQIAEAIAAALPRCDDDGWIASAEVAGAGFLNMRLRAVGWQSAVADALLDAEHYGQAAVGGGARVLVEFVSANPTGPMHVGHGRGAVFGDSLVRLLRYAGYGVHAEYYINNVGNQIAKLGESVWCWLRDDARRAAALRVWEAGEPVAFPDGFPADFPEDGYRGAYIASLAQELRHEPALQAVLAAAPAWSDPGGWHDDQGLVAGADDRVVAVMAWQRMMVRIRADLDLLDIRFDAFHSERWLHGRDPDPRRGAAFDAVTDSVRRLAGVGWVGPGEGADAGAQLFRGSREVMPKAFRDAKDRVVIRSDGRPTYFAADIAYHDDKLARGFDHLINILGADHHGYVPRLQGVIQALGDLRRHEGDSHAARWTGDRLEVILMQMVALLRDGQPVPMGKRSGEFVTLRDVVEEVTTGEPGSGRDAVRFLFLTRKGDAQLDFDLEVARRTSMDNPVYYVQYAHARLCSVLERAAAAGVDVERPVAVAPLASDDERDLSLMVAEWPEVVARAAQAREPHQIAFYAMGLARAVQGWYSRGKGEDARVLADDPAVALARAQLAAAARVALRNALSLLGVRAPTRMVTLADASDAEAPLAPAEQA